MGGAVAGAVLVGGLLFLAFFFYFVPVGLWIQAVTSGAPVGIVTLIGMRLRKVPPAVIIGGRITAHQAGLEVEITARSMSNTVFSEA